MMDFDEQSYLSQTRRLRTLAQEVLTHYDLGRHRLDFVNHGENATYRVRTSKKDYLLRIHCRSHRSKFAISEELKWLKKLNQSSKIRAQRPVASRSGKLLLEVDCDSMGHSRLCDILEWSPGQIRDKKTQDTFFKVGDLMGSLQRNQISTRHRNYWHAEGLLGKKATLGSLEAMNSTFPRYSQRMEESRVTLLKKLKAYERGNPKKMGLIHADLHFGNMIWFQGAVSPIDFDDCGHGLLMYDLAVSLAQSSNYFKRIGKKAAKKAKNDLLRGYEQHMPLTKKDREIIPYLVATRELSMLGWLYGRRDNPELYQYLKKNIGKRIKKTEAYIKQSQELTYF